MLFLLLFTTDDNDITKDACPQKNENKTLRKISFAIEVAQNNQEKTIPATDTPPQRKKSDRELQRLKEREERRKSIIEQMDSQKECQANRLLVSHNCFIIY